MEEVRESSSYDNYLDTDNRIQDDYKATLDKYVGCLLYTSPSPRDNGRSRMPSSA